MGKRQGRSGSGIHDADGNPIQGTRDDDGGFAPETGTYVLSVAEGDALILTDGILAAPLAVATEPH